MKRSECRIAVAYTDTLNILAANIYIGHFLPYIGIWRQCAEKNTHKQKPQQQQQNNRKLVIIE